MGIEKIINRMCIQTAVYWGNPIANGFGGLNYDSPREIKCRWENKSELIEKAEGEEIISNAQVYVLEDLEELGYLYLGNLNDLDSDEQEYPERVSSAFQIKKFDKIPVYKSTKEFFRKAYL